MGSLMRNTPNRDFAGKAKEVEDGGGTEVITKLNMLYAGLDVNLNTNSDTLNYVKEHINDFFVPYVMTVGTDDINFIDEEGLIVDFNEDVFNLEQLSTLLQQATTDNFPLVLMDSNYNRMVMYPSDNGADVVLYLNDRQYVTTITVEFNEDETGSYTLIIGELAYVPIEYQNTLYPSSSFNNIPNDDYNYRLLAMNIMLTDQTLDFGEVLDGLDYLQLIQAQVSHSNNFYWGMINKNFNYIRFMNATERHDDTDVEEPVLVGYDLTFRLYKDGHYYIGRVYYDISNNNLYLLENYIETDSNFNTPKKKVITCHAGFNRDEIVNILMQYVPNSEGYSNNNPETIIYFDDCITAEVANTFDRLDAEALRILFQGYEADSEQGIRVSGAIKEFNLNATSGTQAIGDNNFQLCNYYLNIITEYDDETGETRVSVQWLTSDKQSGLTDDTSTCCSGHITLRIPKIYE